jgi:hypothetical protein
MSSAPDLISPTPFSYGGRVFVCAALRTAIGLYQPIAMCQAIDGQGGMTQLPFDTEPYNSVAEAVRHAEQQAVRWTHDRDGEGQARF